MIRQALTLTFTTTLTLTACTSGSATPTPFTPSAAPTSTQASPDESAQAVAAYKRYIQVIDAMTSSGGVAVKDLPLVTTGIELKASQNQADTYRGRRIRTIGSTEVVWVRAKQPSPSQAGAITAVSVEACYDTSKLRAVDAAGKEIRKPGTPTRWLDSRDLQLVAGSWKVANGRNRGAKC